MPLLAFILNVFLVVGVKRKRKPKTQQKKRFTKLLLTSRRITEIGLQENFKEPKGKKMNEAKPLLTSNGFFYIGKT